MSKKDTGIRGDTRSAVRRLVHVIEDLAREVQQLRIEQYGLRGEIAVLEGLRGRKVVGLCGSVYRCGLHGWENYQPCPECMQAADERRISQQMREG